MDKNKIFIPRNANISIERIIEVINTELQEIHELPITIDENHPNLNEEFCQEMVDAWFEIEGEYYYGNLWADEDTISDSWSQRILEQFKS